MKSHGIHNFGQQSWCKFVDVYVGSLMVTLTTRLAKKRLNAIDVLIILPCQHCQVAMWHRFVTLRSEMADGFASLEGLHLCVWLLRPWPWPWGCQAWKCWMMLNGWFLGHDKLKSALSRFGSIRHPFLNICLENSRHKFLQCPSSQWSFHLSNLSPLIQQHIRNLTGPRRIGTTGVPTMAAISATALSVGSSSWRWPLQLLKIMAWHGLVTNVRRLSFGDGPLGMLKLKDLWKNH